jgi:hypothetical protein
VNKALSTVYAEEMPDEPAGAEADDPAQTETADEAKDTAAEAPDATTTTRDRSADDSPELSGALDLEGSSAAAPTGEPE